MDDCERTANELAERAAEWAGSLFDDAEPGIEGARAVADREPTGELERRAVSLAARVVDLAAERDALAETIDRIAPAVAPNLAEMAGAELAARLIALAGGLEPLAKKPSGTLQVLGAEDALFAHLSGRAPSPKHGIIYTHEYVPEHATRGPGIGFAGTRGQADARGPGGPLLRGTSRDAPRGARERMATIRARAKDESDAAAEGDA